MKKLFHKIADFFRELYQCDPPYECPFCMHCYNNPSEIEDE